MKAGFAKARITPAVGAALCGYHARVGASTGIHDHLFSRALVLESGDNALALISVEVLALSAAFIQEVRGRIARNTPIPEDCVMIAATHTHSGPSTIRTFFNPDENLDSAYMEHLAQSIAQSVSEAWRERFDARVGVGSTAVVGVGTNRRDPDRGPVDREAAIIRIDASQGSTKAVIVVYGCHPTVLGVNNLLITGDYPAMALESIEKTIGTGAFAMFFNGASGDVSIGHSSGLSAIGIQTPNRTFKRAEQLGGKLADAVLRILPAIQTSTEIALGTTALSFTLDGRKYPSVDQLQAALVQAQQLSKSAAGGDTGLLRKSLLEEFYASIRLNNARTVSSLGGRIPFGLWGLRVGDACFVGVPGEIFAETGLEIKKRLGGKAFLIGLANGYVGYLPPSGAYGEGGYEVETTYCDAGSEQHILEAAYRVHRKLYGTKPSMGAGFAGA